jgi:hypothetical protein
MSFDADPRLRRVNQSIIQTPSLNIFKEFSAELVRRAMAADDFYSADRRGEHPAAHPASFTRLLQADGYAGFEALYGSTRIASGGPIVEVAYWSACDRE